MSHVVLGAGISGLSTAFYLHKAGQYGIKVFESTNRVGGWINSVKTKTGAVFELGPRTLRTEGRHAENTLKLAEEVGLLSSVKPVPRTNVAAKRKMLYVNNQLVDTPQGLMSLFRIKPPYMRPLLYALWKDMTTPKKPLDDDSVYNFLARRFGEDYAEIPGSAVVCGVCAGDSKEISIRAIMEESFQYEQKYEGVIRGVMKHAKKRKQYREETTKWISWSLEDGLQTLPIQLKNYLEEGRKADVLLGQKCSNVVFKDRKVILTIDGKEETADHLYSALPSKDLARILGPQHSFLKTELSSIPFVNVAIANFEYAGDLLNRKSFGFLVPPNQNLPILGVVFDSCIFPEEGKTILSVMMGGRWFEKYFGPDPEENLLLQTAKDNIKNILKIDKEPTESRISVLRNCLPQYLVGHTKKVNSIREYIAEKKLPLSLIGNSFDGLSIHESIMSAKKNVENRFPEENQ